MNYFQDDNHDYTVRVLALFIHMSWSSIKYLGPSYKVPGIESYHIRNRSQISLRLLERGGTNTVTKRTSWFLNDPVKVAW